MIRAPLCRLFGHDWLDYAHHGRDWRFCCRCEREQVYAPSIAHGGVRGAWVSEDVYARAGQL